MWISFSKLQAIDKKICPGKPGNNLASLFLQVLGTMMIIKGYRHATFNNLSVLSVLTHLAGVTPVDRAVEFKTIVYTSFIVYSLIVFPRNNSLGQPISRLIEQIIAEINFFHIL